MDSVHCIKPVIYEYSTPKFIINVETGQSRRGMELKVRYTTRVISHHSTPFGLQDNKCDAVGTREGGRSMGCIVRLGNRRKREQGIVVTGGGWTCVVWSARE
ncbi:hypothetical protein AVEN_148780-1 [Araneus ventricosus]|uniref:Uncharacterized protein n=1 Tax=Araneus ventricosus TaxID=182803 RepID=A0A4Y2SVT7_ARAVE|nr:hypothetical protein AVEN_148780-1 [Araneus ventricosus]